MTGGLTRPRLTLLPAYRLLTPTHFYLLLPHHMLQSHSFLGYSSAQPVIHLVFTETTGMGAHKQK